MLRLFIVLRSLLSPSGAQHRPNMGPKRAPKTAQTWIASERKAPQKETPIRRPQTISTRLCFAPLIKANTATSSYGLISLAMLKYVKLCLAMFNCIVYAYLFLVGYAKYAQLFQDMLGYVQRYYICLDMPCWLCKYDQLHLCTITHHCQRQLSPIVNHTPLPAVTYHCTHHNPLLPTLMHGCPQFPNMIKRCPP